MRPPFDEQRHRSGVTRVTPGQEPAHSHSEADNAPSAPGGEQPTRPGARPARPGEQPARPGGQSASPGQHPARPGGHGTSPGEAGAQSAPAAEQADEAASTEHEQQLERDIEELTAKAEKADEYLELARRTRADFDNYRKRAAREAAAAQQRGVTKLVRELLPAVDNLDHALEAVKAVDGSSNGDELVSGIKLVHAELIAALARAGVERFDPEGERFDPQYHEAVGQQRFEGAEPGTIVEVYQRGYRLGDSVIRPARVLVAG